MTIGLIVLAKNEERCIHLPIESAKEYINNIYLIDDGSTDDTVKIASSFGARIIENKIDPHEKGFSEVYNWAIEQVEDDWVLILDADEFLDQPHILHHLQRFSETTAWALPRRKWLKYPVLREEYEAYPDWQPRFFRNIPENRFQGELHKVFKGNLTRAYRGPHIEHLQFQLTSDLKAEYRKELYGHLADLQGVAIERGYRRE